MISQNDVQAAWDRVATEALTFWHVRAFDADGWYWKNTTFFNAPVPRPAPKFTVKGMSEAIGQTEALMPVLRFRLHRMRPEFKGALIVECDEPRMIVYKG